MSGLVLYRHGLHWKLLLSALSPESLYLLRPCSRAFPVFPPVTHDIHVFRDTCTSMYIVLGGHAGMT